MEELDVKFAKLETQFENHVTHVAESMKGFKGEMAEHRSDLRSCVKELQAGSKEFFKNQAAIEQQNDRLAQGAKKMAAQSEDFDNHSDIDNEKGSHGKIAARLHKHFYGKDGAHGIINRKMNLQLIILVILFGVILKSEHREELMSVVSFFLRIIGGGG